MTSLLAIEEPAVTAPRGFALWELGFRPFYLLASTFAAISIGLWGLQWTGWLGSAYLKGPVWHAHEMLFGFALAVIVGFLFTAGRSWSNQPTPTGKTLMALALLWVAARVLVLAPWPWAAALANTAFPLAAAVALAIPLVRGGSRRNYFFPVLLALMSAAALAVHFEHMGIAVLPAWAGIHLALDVVLFIMAVMGGRVLPMFTNNGVPGARAARRPWVETAALASVLVLAAAGLLGVQGGALATIAVVAALAHFVRWWGWQPWRTLRTPIVWVLHLAYLWIPVHLALRAAAAAGLVVDSLAVHALTTGAIGGLVIGMMTRTARGHTARPLRADRRDVACYALVGAAAVTRVLGPLVLPQWTPGWLIASAALWSAGFALYAVAYWPVLIRARLDGKPG